MKYIFYRFVKNCYVCFLLLITFLLYPSLKTDAQVFQPGGKTGVGCISLPGSFLYDSTENIYRLTGSGENIWGSKDAFYFAWKKSAGDLFIQSNIKWTGEGNHPHRKAGWMIRAGLKPDDPYVDAVVHGDGLISLQYRDTTGGETFEVRSHLTSFDDILFERTGDQFTLTVLKDDNLFPVGTITLNLPDTVYTGMIVCSHDSTASATAQFSEVKYAGPGNVPDAVRIIESSLETIDIDTGLRRVIFREKDHFEAPNWGGRDSLFYFNSNGRIFALPVKGGTRKLIPTSFADKCNNDHGLSPDGNKLAISHQGIDNKSRIYVLPSVGGEPKLITEKGPSYWHGWSPNGKILTYCAERNGEYDVYTIPVDGGEEIRLTDAAGLDDGPEYSPDGKYIYFNSVRTGRMKIWRMDADGSNQVQVTPVDQYGDWFPHPSPDGKYIVFLSYDKTVEGHPANKNVVLRLLPVNGGEPEVLAVLFGGQGTINVPSWSPDSKKIAFVSYRLVLP